MAHSQDWLAAPIPEPQTDKGEPGVRSGEASPVPSPATRLNGKFTLRIGAPVEQGNSFVLNKDKLLIGRADPREGISPDIDLASIGLGKEASSVSRRHAELTVVEGGYLITDLGSSLGTTVNDTRLTPGNPCRLNNDDRIYLGQVCLTFIET